jgi:broad specificity phosphatase PhoE
MGLVQDPRGLFQLLANLYIYTWDLGERLDLTDLHLKQVHRLRDRLPPEVFERLYRTYVTARVVARFRRAFGLGGKAAEGS